MGADAAASRPSRVHAQQLGKGTQLPVDTDDGYDDDGYDDLHTATAHSVGHRTSAVLSTGLASLALAGVLRVVLSRTKLLGGGDDGDGDAQNQHDGGDSDDGGAADEGEDSSQWSELSDSVAVSGGGDDDPAAGYEVLGRLRQGASPGTARLRARHHMAAARHSRRRKHKASGRSNRWQALVPTWLPGGPTTGLLSLVLGLACGVAAQRTPRAAPAAAVPVVPTPRTKAEAAATVRPPPAQQPSPPPAPAPAKTPAPAPAPAPAPSVTNAKAEAEQQLRQEQAERLAAQRQAAVAAAARANEERAAAAAAAMRAKMEREATAAAAARAAQEQAARERAAKAEADRAALEAAKEAAAEARRRAAAAEAEAAAARRQAVAAKASIEVKQQAPPAVAPPPPPPVVAPTTHVRRGRPGGRRGRGQGQVRRGGVVGSAVSVAVTLTGAAVIAYGVTRLLTLFGVLEKEGGDGDESEYEEDGEYDEDVLPRRQAARAPGVFGAVEASDEGELWQRAPEDAWLEADGDSEPTIGDASSVFVD